MSVTPEQIDQSHGKIAEHKAEIARIRSMWEKDPLLKSNDGRVAHLEEKIAAEEMFLLKVKALR